jgi:hypothetical protein
MSSSELRRLITLLEAANNSMSKPLVIESVDLNEIEALFKAKFKIRGIYKIDNNGFVSIDGACELKGKIRENKLPIQFTNVTGDFNCMKANLTTLEGVPESVGGSFFCADNQLTSLKGAPNIVGGEFSCHTNPLISLDGIPEKIGPRISLTYDENLPLLRLLQCQSVAFVLARDDPTVDVVSKIINKYACNPSRSNILACQKELIDAGFEGNASW